jgi:hypothetical protein
VAARLPYWPGVHRAGLSAISVELDEAIVPARGGGRLTATRHTALGDAYFARDRLGARRMNCPRRGLTTTRCWCGSPTITSRGATPTPWRAGAVAVRPDDPAVYYRLAVLTAATAPDEAAARLTLVAQKSPDLAPAVQIILDAIAAGQATGSPEVTFAKVGYAFEQLSEWALAELALARAVN